MRRGRRTNKIVSEADVNSGSSADEQQAERPAVILSLPARELPVQEQEESSVEESSDDFFYEDIPTGKTCTECVKKDLIISQYQDKLREAKRESDKNKLYVISNPSVVDSDGKVRNLTKTNVDCWYHGRPHDNFVCPLIESRVGDKWVSIGSFCCINCALGYNFYVINDSRTHEREALTKQWVRHVCKIPISTPLEITVARNLELLVHRGGKMTIEEFQTGFFFLEQGNPPDTVPAEITIDNRKHEAEIADHTELVLSRRKPLHKPSSIVRVMSRK